MLRLIRRARGLQSIVLALAVLVVSAGQPPQRLRPAAQAAPRAAPASLPAGFVDETVLTGLPIITSMAWSPDGRLFIAEKSGRLRIWQNGALLPVPFIDISAQVNNRLDRGLNGFTLHPNFPATPYVYLWFTYDPPDLPSTNLDDKPDGAGARVSRLIRVTVDPDNPNQALPDSEVVLLGTNSTLANIGAPDVYADTYAPWPPASCLAADVYIRDCVPSDSGSHGVGLVLFGPDGALYVGHGDGANFITEDLRAQRAQSLDSLAGKILRIDPETGNGYPDNPFYDGDVTSNRSRVWAYGLRNPFRFTFQPGTGQLIIGDVGWNNWEEIDHGGGHNFGWPCYEGPVPQPGYAALAGATVCQALYAQGPDAITPPYYAYPHVGSTGNALIGGVYTGAGPYPPEYSGVYFFADFATNQIFVLRPGPDDTASAELFEQLDGDLNDAPVQFSLGPDGNVYYLRLNANGAGSGTLHRLRYVSGDNQPPVAVLQASPTNGGLPLAVTYTAAGSADPEGEPLSYLWDWGDGDTSADVSGVHTYTIAGTYQATLTITDTAELTATKQIVLTAGNYAPQATILTPLTGTLVTAGQVISFTGAGNDVDDGTLSGEQLQWFLLLHHYDHIHPNALPPTSGTDGSLTAPDHGDYTWLELCLTVTDTGGLSDTACRPLWPAVGLLQLRTEPPGLQLVYGSLSRLMPFEVAVQVDAQRTVQAPASQSGWTFAGWADGEPSATRTVTGTLATQVLTATYTNTAPIALAAAAPLTGLAPLSVAFTGTASYDPDGVDLSYLWDFGDGVTVTTTDAVHVYPLAGVFTATLTVTDTGGLTAQAFFTINPLPRLWLPQISK